MRLAKFYRAAVAGGEQTIFTETAIIPHRSNRVDHMSGLETIPFGDLGIAGLAAVQHAAFKNKLGPRGPMNRAIDPTAAQQRRIGGVDDGVNAKRCNIGDDDFQPRVA